MKERLKATTRRMIPILAQIVQRYLPGYKIAGATRNTLTLVDSTMLQTGGNLYLGRWSDATNNTLRLVRSTYDFRTIDSKGDVIVGFSGGANVQRKTAFYAVARRKRYPKGE